VTLIVLRDGVMAADTGVWGTDYVMAYETLEKIKRLPNGSLIGGSGDVALIQAYIDWATNDFPPDAKPEAGEKDDDFGAILAMATGEVFLIDYKFRRERVDAPFVVQGSHGEFAYACLLAGCSAAETVALAIKHTSHTAGRVVTHRLAQEEEAEPPEPTVEDVMDELPIDPAVEGTKEYYGL
jgi:hypothetical protein